MLDSIDVSIIIVSYNTCEHTVNCIKSIVEKTIGVTYEIIVSDNGSNDKTCEMLRELFPQIIIIENKVNYGFGKANNIGRNRAKGKYILYLNSDTVLLNNAVKEFCDYFEGYNEGNLGCIGCYLVDEKNRPCASAGGYIKPFRTLLTFLHILLSPKDMYKIGTSIETTGENKVIKNGFIIGADMFLRNDGRAIFDERYFMYSEEMDLQYNSFYINGYDCVLIKEPKIVHFGGKSNHDSDEDIFRRVSVRWLWISRLQYMKKNCQHAGLICRIIKTILKHKWKKYDVDDILPLQMEKLRSI